MAEWEFFLDENIDPKVETYLEKERVSAVHVRDSLGLGASDEEEILPFAIERDYIIVTSDVTDFGTLSAEADPPVILLHDDTLPAYRVAASLLRMTETYSNRETFTGREILDDWL